MNKEEAINKVKGCLTDYFPIEDYGEVEEIIKALKQESCEDAISRAEAIDAMTHWFSDMLETGKEKYSIDDVLNSLSPVTPTRIETVTEFADRCRECGKTAITRAENVEARIEESEDKE